MHPATTYPFAPDRKKGKTIPMAARLPDPDYDAVFYAGIPAKRLFAWVIDVILITLVTLIVGVLTLSALLWIWPVTYFVTSFLYRSLTIAGGSATLGMRLMDIQLRNAQGAKLTPQEAAFHTGAYLIASAFVILQLISVFLIATGPRHQGLHDFLLGTAAINRPR